MKILIAYTSAHGTTRACAELLSKELESKGEITLVDMNTQKAPSPDGFDAVVLGGSIRFAKISKKLKAYIKEHKAELEKGNCGVFLCCGVPDEFESYAKEQLPKGIELGLGVAHFGGELKPKNVKGIFDKLVVRAMRKEITEHDFEDATYKEVLPEILPENIKNFAVKVIDAIYN